MKILEERDVDELIDKLFYRRLLNNPWNCECRYVIRKIEESILEKIDKNNKIYKKALEEIVREQGKVCSEFEICRHISCSSSCASWFIADRALKKAEGSTLYESKRADEKAE